MNSEKPRRRRSRAALLLAAPAVLVGLLALSPHMMPTWAGELAASWTPQVALVLLLSAALSLGLRRRGWALAQFLLVLGLAGGMTPALLDGAQRIAAPDAVGAGSVRIVFANINRSNDDLAPLAAWVAAQQADVVVLTEVEPRHVALAEAAFAGYPERLLEPRRHAFGILIFSRVAITARTVTPLSDVGAAPVLAQATLELAGSTLRIAGMHPWPPLLPDMRRERDRQLERAADLIAGAQGAVVVLGDFNATPWSPALRSFAAGAGLRGANLMATWPVMLGPAGIAIDHALVGGGAVITRFATGPDIGSDHRPIVVDVVPGGDQGSPGTP